MADMIDGAGDGRTANNTVRHQYRILTEAEKAQVTVIKDAGADFLTLLSGVGASRELSLTRTKVEEAVFWAVKHVTA